MAKRVLIDLSNKTFGYWYVIDRNREAEGKTKYRSAIWNCRCTCCGIVKPIKSANLRKSRSISCRKCSKGYKKRHILISSYWQEIKSHAVARNLEFAITKDYVWKLYIEQKMKCKLTSIPIYIAINNVDHIKHRKTTASLDRIDSNKGYIVGNVQWVTKPINRMKFNLPQDQFIELCKLVAKYN
jgi:hypothetical protein